MELLFKAAGGRVRIDGNSIDEYDVNQFRRQVAVVNQVHLAHFASKGHISNG